MAVASAMDGVKQGLDLFAELLLYHAQLCRAVHLAAETDCDRAAYRNAFKALIDIVRYSEVPGASNSAVESRQCTTARLVRDTASPHHSLVTQFFRWQARGYAAWNGGRGLVGEAQHATFCTLREQARDRESGSTAADPGSARFEVRTGGHEHQRDTLRSNGVDAPWRETTADILDRAGSALLAVWPSYYHLYLVVDDGADRQALTEIAELTEAVLNERQKSLFTRSRRERPVLRCRPMPLPQVALKPLLYSSYLNKPFKYFDFIHEHVSARSADFKDRVGRPPDMLILEMAREALAHLALTIRMDPGRLESSDQVYRMFLRVLEVALFLERHIIVVPLAGTADVFKTEYGGECAWLERLERDCLPDPANGDQHAEQIFYRYYPHVKPILDRLARSQG